MHVPYEVPRFSISGAVPSDADVDLIGRYGGEELVIFLPETDLETALQVAERLRNSVEQTPIRVSDKELHITVSIGVSGRNENTLDMETLIARADQGA